MNTEERSQHRLTAEEREARDAQQDRDILKALVSAQQAITRLLQVPVKPESRKYGTSILADLRYGASVLKRRKGVLDGN